MVTAMELAMQKAQQEAREARLRSTVANWSRDDTTHVDPPLQQSPATPKEPPVAHETPAANNKQPPFTNAEAPPKPRAERKFNLPHPDTMGVTEACQQAVRDNPGAQRVELIRAMEAIGYKYSSLSSIFGVLHTQKIIRADKEGHLWANYKRFRPVLGREAWAKKQKQANKSAGRPGLPKPHKHGRVNGMSYTESARLGGKASHAAKALGMKHGEADRATTTTQRANKRDSVAYALYTRWTKNPVSYDKWLAQRGKAPAPKYVVSRSTKALGKAKPAARPPETTPRVPPLDKQASRSDPTGRFANLTLVGPSLVDLSPTQVVNGMSAMQAHAVFKLLRAMFKE